MTTHEQPEANAEGIEAKPVDELEELRQSLAEATARAEANLAGWQRAQADYQNHRRRCEQEKEEIAVSARSEVMLNILSVLDDMERAMAAAPQDASNQPWLEGVKLIEQKLKSRLELLGLSPIKALGEPFDPKFHEAVGQMPGKEGIVVHEVRRGYTLNNRLLRPASVMVGSGEESTVNEEES